MSKILKLRMLSDEVADFVRDYEVQENIDLVELHDFICANLGYDPMNFCSFFASNQQWEKLQEYTLEEMYDGDDEEVVALPMEGTTFKDIIASGASRLIFMFDILTARSLFIEIKSVKDSVAGVEYPRVTDMIGVPPVQADEDGMMSEESPFDDMMSDFADFEGSDEEGYSDDL